MCGVDGEEASRTVNPEWVRGSLENHWLPWMTIAGLGCLAVGVFV